MIAPAPDLFAKASAVDESAEIPLDPYADDGEPSEPFSPLEIQPATFPQCVALVGVCLLIGCALGLAV